MTATPMKMRAGMNIPLDPRQKDAAEAPVGPVVIIGGPGAGKTHTIVGRVGALIEGGANPSTIACLTFSSRSADQIKEKMEESFPDDPTLRRLYIGTFHSYASKFLREAGAGRINRDANFTLWDQEQSTLVLTGIIEENTDRYTLTPKDVRNFLHWHSINNARWLEEPVPAEDITWHYLMEAYEHAKQTQNTMDLDDLTPMAVKAMEADGRIRAYWNNVRTRHLIIDEFQDITPVQYRLIELMTGPEKSVTIATDPNQAIYGWRGSDPKMLERFRINHPNNEVHLLVLNHRSTTTIVNLATTLKESPEMQGLTEDYQKAIRPAGPPPRILEAQGDDTILVMDVLDRCAKLVDAGLREWTDLAILYRRSKIRGSLRTNLESRRIPHQILGEVRKTGYTTVHRVIDLITSYLNPKDSAAFTNAASVEPGETRRGLNKEIAKRVIAMAEEHKITLVEAAVRYLPVLKGSARTRQNLEHIIWAHSIIDDYIEETLDADLQGLCHLACRIVATKNRENVSEGVNPQATHLMSLARSTHMLPREDLRQHTARFLELLKSSVHPDMQGADNDDLTEEVKGLTLSTIHASKGLQWKTVFIMDASDHVIPGTSNPNNTAHIEEEQRIFYVAATRATDEIYFCSATQSGWDNNAALTRFLEPVRHLMEYQEV